MKYISSSVHTGGWIPTRIKAQALGIILVTGLTVIIVMLGATKTATAREHSTFQISYHPNIVGDRLSADLEALDTEPKGLFGEKSRILSIQDVNRSKGTTYLRFEDWLAASPDDPTASALANVLSRARMSSSGTTANRGGR